MSNEIEVRKLMRKYEDETERQFYPETNVQAINGLEELLSGQGATNGASESFVSLKCGQALQSAKAYTDQKISELDLTGGGEVSQAYVDQQDAAILEAAKAYTDEYAGSGGSGSDYTLPTASSSTKGGVKVGARLTMTGDVLAADKQTDFNFTGELKAKLESLKVYKAGANITIAADGTISSTGGGGSSGGVSQEYVDVNDVATLNAAKDYTYSREEINQKIGSDATVASNTTLGKIKVGDRLAIDVDGKLSAEAQTDNNYSTAEKEKLAEIESGANRYVLPGSVVMDANYVHTDNNYTSADKNKLAGLNDYVLPVATTNQLGGVKVGNGLTIEDGVLNVKSGGTSDLSDYYKKTETYSRVEVDNKIAQVSNIESIVWSGTQAEYDALSETERNKYLFCAIEGSLVTVDFEKVGEVS